MDCVQMVANEAEANGWMERALRTSLHNLIRCRNLAFLFLAFHPRALQCVSPSLTGLAFFNTPSFFCANADNILILALIRRVQCWPSPRLLQSQWLVLSIKLSHFYLLLVLLARVSPTVDM
jgi:hypothetical protein